MMVYTDGKLYCGNPQCGTEIKGNEISYSGMNIYHPGDCQLFAVAHLALKYEGVVLGRFEVINREAALRLLREGGLEQKIKAGFFSRLIKFFER